MNNNNLGNRIKTIRIKKGLTLEKFGKLILNANKSIVSKWENNQTTPNNERLVKIAEIGNVPFEYLISGNPFELLSDEDKQNHMYERDLFNSIEEYKELEYPDTKDSLSKSEVYHNKKRLNKETKILASKILDVLSEDLEVNYPSSERIEEEYEKRIKAAEVLKRRSKEKEGE